MATSGPAIPIQAQCFLLFYPHAATNCFRCQANFSWPTKFKEEYRREFMSKAGRTILVGEDELEVRGYLEMALKCLGYTVELAQDGDEVLACLQTSRVDISAVLLDIMMPNRDGMETLREIRKIDPALPVIIVSGASSTMNIVTAMKA